MRVQVVAQAGLARRLALLGRYGIRLYTSLQATKLITRSTTALIPMIGGASTPQTGRLPSNYANG